MSGVVYQLKATLDNQDSIFYIGSTTDLVQRMRQHELVLGSCSSRLLYETGCPVTCTVLEDVDFGLNTDQLRIREQYWIDLCKSLSDNCVNILAAYVSPAQKKKNKHAYYKANPELKIRSRLRYQNDPIAAARQKENQRLKRDDRILFRATMKLINKCRRYPRFKH